MAVPRTPLPERGPTAVSGYSGNLEDDSDKSSLNYNNFTPSHARCTQRKGGSGGKREHDYINHDIHPQKEHIRWKCLKKGKPGI